MDVKNENNKESLKERTVKGVIWSAFDSISGLAVQMVCSLIVARLLTPEDFGIVGMITVFSAIGLILIDSGFGQALIRKQDATQNDYSSVFYFNILLSLVIYVALYLSSPLIETFYEIKGLTKICRVIFLIIPINAIGLIQNTILTKKIDFKTLSIISFISALISGLTGVFTAYYLKTVWAIVYQMVSMYFIRTLMLWILSKWRPSSKLTIKPIKEMFPYAGNLLLTGLFGTIVNNICPLIIGKIYSATQLGYFSQADKLQKLPSTTATAIIQRVTFPVLVEIQDDNIRLKAAYLKILSQAVYFISPIMIINLVIAPPLFNVILGQEWKTAAYYFQILCISGLFYPISCLTLNIINIKGNTTLLFYLEVLRKAIFFLIIVISMFFSIEFFIWMQAAYALIQLVINLYFSGRQINLKVSEQLKTTIPLILLSVFSSIPAIGFIYFLDISDYSILALSVSSFIIFYILNSILLHLPQYKESLIIVKRFFGKKKDK